MHFPLAQFQTRSVESQLALMAPSSPSATSGEGGCRPIRVRVRVRLRVRLPAPRGCRGVCELGAFNYHRRDPPLVTREAPRRGQGGVMGPLLALPRVAAFRAFQRGDFPDMQGCVEGAADDALCAEPGDARDLPRARVGVRVCMGVGVAYPVSVADEDLNAFTGERIPDPQFVVVAARNEPCVAVL